MTTTPAPAALHELERGLAMARGPDLDLALALSAPGDPALTLIFVGARDLVVPLVRRLRGGAARSADGLLDGARTEVRRPLRTAGATRESGLGLACRVAGWSVRVLPAGERERYRDEFAAELYSLRGPPRRRRVGYAVRLLVRSVSLRRALQQPAPVAPARDR